MEMKSEKNSLKNQKHKILLVDDEQMIRWSLSEALRGWGYEPVEAGTANAALMAFEAEPPAAILLDINLPDGSGLDVLRKIRHRQPDAVVIMITANVLVDETIGALRGGAYDFIGKPINLEELHVAIRNGIEASDLRKEVTQFRRERAQQFTFDQIIGQSPVMCEMLAMARKVAESEVSSVLLQGESGTGKDLVAKAIHYQSHRSAGPFIAINCAAIPATLIESELFGYEKGAFTDAKARKEGMFEQAEGGTLLLDEIGELELSLQAKLLRVLEEGMFRRVGGLKDIPFDARIIAASNRDLRTESEAGRFRLDLYYRLSVIQIDIPALRERGDDVIQLAEYYIESFGKRLRKSVRGIEGDVAEAFRLYNWPGNVRELRNVIERALILEEDDVITTRYVPRNLVAGKNGSIAERDGLGVQEMFPLPLAGASLEDVEMSLVRQAIDRSGGNQTRAAELLGISRDQLRYRLKKLEETARAVVQVSAD
ncbi:MAG: two-component system, NtrC family, response regulator AtoC [Blastocatellia bacterium]|jgi:DNA-binding NtrC family response regulator|nr:two-component system, NtrC family, response regulator AtoC [Blastocatellia bacterium]